MTQQSQTMQDEILTLQEVASFLKLVDKSIYRLAQRGDLPGFKAGGAWRFRRRDLNAWIESRMTGIDPLKPAETQSTKRRVTGKNKGSGRNRG